MGIKGNFWRVIILRSCLACLIVMVLGVVVVIRDDFTRGDYSEFRNELAKIFLIKKLIEQRERTKIQATAMQLSFYEPASFENLQKIIQGREPAQAENLSVYKAYYEKALQWFPQIQEIKGVLAFIYYYIGEDGKAIELYEQAIRQDPYFFWNHYNLGVILYEQKRYPQALQEFKKALSCPFDLNVQFIARSRIYLQIFWPSQNWNGYSPSKSLEVGIRQAQNFLKEPSPGASYGRFLRIF